MRLAKSASFTRWDTRPLSAEQLGYAREDVVHLLELAGELELACEERAAGVGPRGVRAARALKRRARSGGDLRAPAAGRRPERLGAPDRARAVRWREQTAARADRPVQSVLSDVALMEIAKRKPSSRKELERIRGVGAGARHRRAEELLEVVRRAGQQPPDAAPGAGARRWLKPEDAPLVALAEALLRARARRRARL